MGRLVNTNDIVSSGTTEITTSGTTGKTLNVYNFVDEYGNVTQIEKKSKTRLKYYPDARTIQEILVPEQWIIGVSDDTPMGTDDDQMDYAIYQ